MGEIGAGDGIRTRDINLGKVALYQLSYSRLRATSSFLLHLQSSVNSIKKLRRGANIFLVKWYCFPHLVRAISRLFVVNYKSVSFLVGERLNCDILGVARAR